MLFYYVQLRLKQFLRFYSFSDIHPLLGIPVTLLLFIFLSAMLFVKTPYAGWVYCGLAIYIVTELQPAKHNDYLRQMLPRSMFFKAKLAENLVILLPFFLVMAWYHTWLQLLTAIACIIPYSWFNLKMPKPKLKALRTPYAPYAFEHNMVFRSMFVVYIIYILLLVIGAVVQNFYVFLAPFFIMLFFSTTAYSLPEEPFYIWIYKTGAGNFLFSKLKTLVVNYSITFAPFLLLGALFYTSQLPVVLLCLVVGILALAGCLFIKYHFYPSAIVVQVSQLVFFAFTVACMASPLMLPAVVLFLLFSFLRAKRNLKFILKC